jgi:hypothetical protein
MQGTTISAIMASNPTITDANKIQAGASLNLPSKTVSPVAPVTQPITTNVPQTVQTPTLPTPTNTTDTYYQSLNQQVTDATSKLETERQNQLDKIQQDKSQAQADLDTLRNAQGDIINEQGATAIAEKQAKLDALDLETQRFNENYNIVQGLASQLTDLMTQGNNLIASEKAKTGLSSIRNPRITETINNITAQTGVIQAGISVYNGQMSQAQNQLTLATNTITSAYSDQLDYYTTLANFYESQATDTNNKLITLTKDEKDFMDTKIASLEADKAKVEENADYIKELMTNPTSALFMSQAGVSLLDSPEVVNQKMAIQTQRQEVIDTQNEYVSKGYTPSAVPTANTITIQSGGQNLYFKPPTTKFTGYSGDDVVSIKADIAKYGLDKVLEGVTDPDQVKAIQDIAKTVEQKVSKENIEAIVTQKSAMEGLRDTYTDDELKKLADDYGYSSFWTGKTSDIDRFLNSTEAKTVYVDLLYKQYEQAGMAK